MGSPGRNLSVPEHLRAWHEAGLHYVLQPGRSVPARDDSSDSSSHVSTPKQSSVSPTVKSAQNTHMVSPRESSTGGGKHAAFRAGDTLSEELCVERQSNSSQEDYTQWVEPWRSIWLKTPHEPRIVWTYRALGEHMGGKPDSDIGKLLQSIIYYFRWPKGTIAFWPMTELVSGELVSNSDMFWRGVDQLKVAHIACFGPDVLPVVAPDAPRQVHKVRVGDVFLHQLPTLAELAPMLPHERLIALQSLKLLAF